MQTELDRETGARLLLSRTAFPGTIAAAYGAHFLLQTWSVPLSVTPYIAALLAAAVVTAMEFVIPYDRSWHPQWIDVKNDLLFMVTVQVLVPVGLSWFFSVTLIQYVPTLGLSVTRLWPRNLPLLVQFILMLVTIAFFRYWLHVAAHNTKTLWSLHAVHHSPKKLYWLNVGRFHPVEKSLQYLLDAFPFIVLGVSLDVIALYFIFFAVVGFYEHSNTNTRYGIFNYIVSSPELHRWHHSRLIKESNHNYGNTLIVWDLVFGSWRLPRDRRVGELGLINRNYPLGFFKQMTTPFVPGLDKKPPGTANAS